jgi:hypothetical protein
MDISRIPLPSPAWRCRLQHRDTHELVILAQNVVKLPALLEWNNTHLMG